MALLWFYCMIVKPGLMWPQGLKVKYWYFKSCNRIRSLDIRDELNRICTASLRIWKIINKIETAMSLGVPPKLAVTCKAIGRWKTERPWNAWKTKQSMLNPCREVEELSEFKYLSVNIVSFTSEGELCCLLLMANLDV